MIIGIDLGTTNSLAAVWRNGQSELIPNALGKVRISRSFLPKLTR